MSLERWYEDMPKDTLGSILAPLSTLDKLLVLTRADRMFELRRAGRYYGGILTPGMKADLLKGIHA